MMSTNFKVSKVNFKNDTLLIIRDTETNIYYVSFQYIFSALGLNEKQSASQEKKLRKDPILAPHMITFNPKIYNLPLDKDLLCISLDKLQLALCKVSFTPKTKQLAPELEKKLLIYQRECADTISSHINVIDPVFLLRANPNTESDTLKAIKLLTQSINIAFCSINERLSNMEERLAQSEVISNSTNISSEKIITSDWTEKIFRKYDLITEALGITYKMLYQQIIKVIQKKYKNININQVICNYCDKHNIKTCYPLEAIEDDEITRTAFENTLDNIIYNCKLNRSKKNYMK